MSTEPKIDDEGYPYVTDPTAVMSADVSRCPRCGTKFADHGDVCGETQPLKVDHG